MRIAVLRIVAVVFVASAAAIVYFSSALLPDTVAGNFGPGGTPTGFTDRDTYRAYMSTLTFAAPLLVYGLVVWLPRAIPRPSWLANPPARRRPPSEDIERLWILVACIVGLFGVLMHAVVIRANSFSPPYFEAWPRWSLLALWLVFIALVVAGHHRKRSGAL